MKEEYTKTYLNEDEKIKHLMDRGVNCEEYIKQFLQTESFSTLLEYVKCSNRKHKSIYDLQSLLYADRELRNIILAIIDVIESHFKTTVSEFLASDPKDGPFFYLNNMEKYFLNTRIDFVKKIVKDVAGIVAQSDEISIKYYKQFKEFPYMPFWSFVKFFSFGEIYKFFESLNPKYSDAISKIYGSRIDILNSLKEFSRLRNACAHNQRLWNCNSNYKDYIRKQIEKIRNFLKSEPYEYPNKIFLAQSDKRLKEFIAGNEQFINDGYGY